jgi:large subunit ribosomal protein L25
MEVPDRFEVDISALTIGDSLRVSDIRPPEGVTILDDPEAVVLNVTPPTKIEEPEPEEAEELEEGELPEGVEGEEGAEPEAEGEPAEAAPDENE